MTHAGSGRRLAAASLAGLVAALAACGHYGPPLRVQAPPPNAPPGTPAAAIPEVPPKAVPPASHTPTPMDNDDEEWTP
jgi:hypothetical protein